MSLYNKRLQITLAVLYPLLIIGTTYFQHGVFMSTLGVVISIVYVILWRNFKYVLLSIFLNCTITLPVWYYEFLPNSSVYYRESIQEWLPLDLINITLFYVLLLAAVGVRNLIREALHRRKGRFDL